MLKNEVLRCIQMPKFYPISQGSLLCKVESEYWECVSKNEPTNLSKEGNKYPNRPTSCYSQQFNPWTSTLLGLELVAFSEISDKTLCQNFWLHQLLYITLRMDTQPLWTSDQPCQPRKCKCCEFYISSNISWALETTHTTPYAREPLNSGTFLESK